MGLTRYGASRYFARLPTHNAESGSLALCTVHFLLLPSDPAVTSNALAIRIVFPLVGVTPAFRRLGLPAMPGKQKKGPGKTPKTLVFSMEAASRFELENVGFAGRCLTTWPSRQCMERETGVEPATSTLARSHSTTELFPLSKSVHFLL